MSLQRTMHKVQRMNTKFQFWTVRIHFCNMHAMTIIETEQFSSCCGLGYSRGGCGYKWVSWALLWWKPSVPWLHCCWFLDNDVTLQVSLMQSLGTSGYQVPKSAFTICYTWLCIYNLLKVKCFSLQNSGLGPMLDHFGHDTSLLKVCNGCSSI
jgi:hypothetical protein